MNKDLLLYVLLIFFLTGFQHQAYSQYVPLNVKDGLLKILEDNKRTNEIVLLGEQNHSIREHFVTSFSLVQDLANLYNYEVLLTESDFLETFISLKNNKKFTMSTIGPIYHLSSEYKILEKLEGKLNHAGFDCQVNLAETDAVFLADYFGLEAGEKEIFEEGVILLADTKRGGNKFEDLLRKLLQKDISALDRQVLKNLLVCSEFRDLEQLYAKDWKPFNGNLRDSMMAENILFWYEYFGKKKFIGLGASTHLAYGFSSLDHNDLARYNVAGSYLKKWQGTQIKQDIVNIAFTSAKGWGRPATNFEKENNEPVQGTIEYEVLKSGKEYEVFNLTDKKYFSSKAIDGVVLKGDFSAVWDLLVVFSEATGNERYKSEGYIVEVEDRLRKQVRDSETNEPVSFAHVIIDGLQEGTISNSDGYFSLLNNKEYQNRQITISAIGYTIKQIPFAEMNTTKPVKLQPAVTLLKEVVVGAKAETPKAILTQVIKNIHEQNKLQHIHYFQINSEVAQETDTLHVSTINEIALLNEQTFALNIMGSKPYDKKKFNELGFYVSYPWRGLLNNHYFLSPLFKENNLDKFDLSIDKGLSEKEGIVISFKAKNFSKRFLNQSNVVSYEGKVWTSVEGNYLKKAFFDVKYEDGGSFSTILFYEFIDQELVPVFVQEESVIKGKKIVNQSSWLKSVPYTGQKLIMNHDFLSVQPSKKIFEAYNQFVKE